jgi:hypothetical protein
VGIRETLNENPRLTTGITIGIIVVVLGFILWQMHGGSSSTPDGGGRSGGAQAYFSDDDGKTYFPDAATKVPPFDHGGKEAVRAHVLKCDGKTFVNFLERYTPEGKKKMEAMGGKPPVGDPTAMESVRSAGMEVKRPGDKEWIRANPNDPRYGDVIRWQCKDIENAQELVP